MKRTALICIILVLCEQGVAQLAPPQNPWLADSVNPVSHGSPAQQDSVAIAGPRDGSRALDEDEIDYAPIGPAQFGGFVSSPYPDGTRVIWSNALNGVFKLDHESFEVLATLPTEAAKKYTPEYADEKIERFDDSNSGPFSLIAAMRTGMMLRDLAGVYAMIDRNNTFYVGDKSGAVIAYGDANSGDPTGPIRELRRYQLPDTVTGPLIGINMTFDGYIVAATEHGYVVAIDRHSGDAAIVRLKHHEQGSTESTGDTGEGWVRNPMAIDAEGGIYVASRDHLHKVVWNGEMLSADEDDGAWSVVYRNSTGRGTGSTPSLVGFGPDEDHFVVISDGDVQMNVVYLWRDEIPESWTQIDGAPSRRIAGQLPVTMGDENLDAIQSEQSVVTAGYGAFVVNNNARNVPWYAPDRTSTLFSSFLGANPKYQPYGVQKFAWNPVARSLEVAWSRKDVSSPNSVPLVSMESNLVYFVGARNNQWTLQALDWSTGQSVFHYVVGGERYNSLFSATSIDQSGRIFWGTTWGRVRLNPKESP